MNIAVLTPDDWQLLRQVRLKALADCPDAFTATLEAEIGMTEDDWRMLLANADWRTFIALVGVTAGGNVCGGTIDGRKGLFSMWVDPQFRGKSVGDLLIGSVIEWAKSEQAATLYLEVADVNSSAIRLYERHGFLPTGNVSACRRPASTSKSMNVYWFCHKTHSGHMSAARRSLNTMCNGCTPSGTISIGNLNLKRLAAKIMDTVMCPHGHFADAIWDYNSRLAACKWLFVDMRMRQYTLAVYRSIRSNNLPPVGIVMPTLHRHVEW